MSEGTFIRYQELRFSEEARRKIHAANAIIDEYDGAITLRQLYYQHVARGLIPNRPEEYKALGELIKRGRLAGLVSWTALEDLGRNLMGSQHYKDVKAGVRDLREKFRLDLWKRQACRPEVWIEKQALQNVIASVCDELRVDYFATRGYNSVTEQWRAGQRFASYVQRGQRPIVIHLGDHDPSGIDMTRDNRERLELFAGVPILVVRVALNWEQVQQYDLPPNPAKFEDPRATDYMSKYGESSWELDALAPPVIHRIIEKAVHGFRDPALWDEAVAEEAAALDELDIIMENMQ